MPKTTCAAILVGLVSGVIMKLKLTNIAAPKATIALVRIPANLCLHCLSAPIVAPKIEAATTYSVNLIISNLLSSIS